ncbi:hypothetical protein ACFSQJ_09020 [Croceitalea marina]|uniref:CBM-cenC domain-containing protein n=1 Tax=Croceitalea marina TaxID=1775166 RepID=A0ABW5MXH3_9FLAO
MLNIMKSYAPSSLVMLFVFSILCFISCSKDSDLFAEAILLDEEEIEAIEEAGSDSTDGTDGSDGSEAKEGDGTNLVRNGTFENDDEWVLRNGSTIDNGILTIIANGSVGSSRNNWSAEVQNVLSIQYYGTRRFRFTFDARQISGNGEFQIGQRNNAAFEQVITSDWTTYTVEVDGNVPNAGNDINIGGRDVGDVFEVDNFKMEIIGDTSNHNVPQKGGQFTFFTDFEFETYGYDQWTSSGGQTRHANDWEVDHGLPRTTAHPNSPLTTGRDGTGSAIWLGSYNNDQRRNEVGRDIAMDFEHAISFSFYVQNELPPSRLLLQNRNLAPGGSSTVNSISIRQADTPGKMFFSLCTDVNAVDQSAATLGGWNGAGTGTTSVYFDYNYRAWNDVVILYKGAFGANYTGPSTSELAEVFGYDPRSDGYIEIWVNGNKIVDHVGTTLYRYERRGGEIRSGITPKIGAYWGGAFDPQGDIYYDNYGIWNGPDATFSIMDPSK